MSVFNPQSAEELIARWPLQNEWLAEIEAGWDGPDGSTSSLDNIEGIRIGKTSKAWLPELPANLHDSRYRCLRRLLHFKQIDKRKWKKMRAAADEEHLERLLFSVGLLVGFHGFKARIRCHIRYWAIRLFAGSAAKPRKDERYS